MVDINSCKERRYWSGLNVEYSLTFAACQGSASLTGPEIVKVEKNQNTISNFEAHLSMESHILQKVTVVSF